MSIFQIEPQGLSSILSGNHFQHLLHVFSNTNYLNDLSHFVKKDKKIIKLNKNYFCQSLVISLKLNSFICLIPLYFLNETLCIQINVKFVKILIQIIFHPN